MDKNSLTNLLKDRGFTHRETSSKGLNIGTREIVKDDKVVFVGNYEEVKAWLDEYDIEDFNSSIYVEIEKYIRLCPTCHHFDKKDKVCDMCDYGGLAVRNNHGLSPREVQVCDVYKWCK